MSTVAVLGLNGFLGKPVVEALLTEPFNSKVKSPIHLLTFSDKRPFDDSENNKIKYFNVSNGFDEALKGVDSVVNLTGFPNPSSEPFLDAIVRNKVKLYIPSQFGVDLQASHGLFPQLQQGKMDHSQRARDNDVKTIDIYAGFFFLEVNNPFITPLVKIDGMKAIISGNEELVVNPTYLRDVGKTVASVLTTSIGDYSKLPDRIRVYSDRVTIGDLLKRYEKIHSVQLERVYKSGEEYLQTIKDKYSKDGYVPKEFFSYMGGMLIAGEGNGLIYEQENEKEVVNPNESYFKWTRFEY